MWLTWPLKISPFHHLEKLLGCFAVSFGSVSIWSCYFYQLSHKAIHAYAITLPPPCLKGDVFFVNLFVDMLKGSRLHLTITKETSIWSAKAKSNSCYHKQRCCWSSHSYLKDRSNTYSNQTFAQPDIAHLVMCQHVWKRLKHMSNHAGLISWRTQRTSAGLLPSATILSTGAEMTQFLHSSKTCGLRITTIIPHSSD